VGDVQGVEAVVEIVKVCVLAALHALLTVTIAVMLIAQQVVRTHVLVAALTQLALEGRYDHAF
jgi:hypothetical protein